MSYIITEGSEDLGLENYVGERKGSDIEFIQGDVIHPFRLLDDDDIVYFEGRESDSSSFDPLDYFGVAFGCTSIEYLENGKWEAL